MKVNWQEVFNTSILAATLTAIWGSILTLAITLIARL